MPALLIIIFIILAAVVSPWYWIGVGAILLLMIWAQEPVHRGTHYYGARRKQSRLRRGGR